MKSLSTTKSKAMSANALRQARYAEKMREKGMKRLTLWVTPEQEREIHSLLFSAFKIEGESMCLMEFCEVRAGALVPTYRRLLEPTLCDRCGKGFSLEADEGSVREEGAFCNRHLP